MIGATSLTSGVIKIITTSPVKDFLISIVASSSWDGMKKIVNHFNENSTEKIIWDIFLTQCHSFMDNFTMNIMRLLL